MDYIQRMKNEKFELEKKLGVLREFTEESQEFRNMFTQDQELMHAQDGIMTTYINILSLRIRSASRPPDEKGL